MLKKNEKSYMIRGFILLTLFCILLDSMTKIVYAEPLKWVDGSDLKIEGGVGGDPSNLLDADVVVNGIKQIDVWDKNSVPWNNANITTDGEGNTTIEETKDDVNWLDGALGRIAASIGCGIEGWLSFAGVSIDTFLFGKLSPKPIALTDSPIAVEQLFAFSLDDGNPYGYVGAIIYSALRVIMCAFVAVMVMWQLAKAGVSVTGQDKSIMKEAFYSGIIVIAMLFFMPNIIDLIIYIKDSLLVLISKSLFADGHSISIVKNCWENFLSHSGFINGLIYTASVVFMLYLMALYIGNAIAMACLFAFFPFIAFLSITDKGTFSNWFKQVIGTIMIPVIDAVLLVVPAYLCGISGFVGVVISLIACFFVVPARQAIKQALGFGGAGFGEAAGLGAMRAVGSAAIAATKGAAGLAKGLKENSDARKEDFDKAQKDIDSDLAKADAYDALAKNENGDMKHDTSLDDKGIQSNIAPNTKTSEVDPDSFKTNTENIGSGLEKGSADNESEPITDGKGNSQTFGDYGSEGGEPPTGFGGTERTDGTGGADGSITGGSDIITSPEGTSDIDTANFENNQTGTGGYQSLGDTTAGGQSNSNVDANVDLSSQDARMQNLDDMTRAQDTIQAKEMEMAELDRTAAAIKESDANIDAKMHDEMRTYDAKHPEATAGERAAFKAQLADNPDYQKGILRDANGKIVRDKDGNAFATTAGINSAKQRAQGEILAARNVQQNARELEGRFAMADKLSGGTGKTYNDSNEMAMDQNHNAALRSIANHRTFDSPEFNNVLSNADKAQFYRERAMQKKQDQAQALQKSFKNDRQMIVSSLAKASGAALGGAMFAMTGENGARMGAMLGSSLADATVSGVQYSETAQANGDKDMKKWAKAETRRVQHVAAQTSLTEKAQTNVMQAQNYRTQANTQLAQGGGGSTAKSNVYKMAGHISIAEAKINTAKRGLNEFGNNASNVVSKITNPVATMRGQTAEQYYGQKVQAHYRAEHAGDVKSAPLDGGKVPTMLKGTTPVRRVTQAYDPGKYRGAVQAGFIDPETSKSSSEKLSLKASEHENLENIEREEDAKREGQKNSRATEGAKGSPKKEKWTKSAENENEYIDYNTEDDYEDDDQ